MTKEAKSESREKAQERTNTQSGRLGRAKRTGTVGSRLNGGEKQGADGKAGGGKITVTTTEGQGGHAESDGTPESDGALEQSHV